MTEREERTAFTVLVLSGLWLVLRAAVFGRAPHSDAMDWRAHAIAHMDEIGQKTDEAKTYRREVTFPEIR